MQLRIKIIFVSIAVGAALFPNPKLMTSKTSHESTVSITVPDALDLWIERLAYFESNGREDIDIIDSNGKHSRGCLQFQDATWHEQSRIYRLHAPIMDCLAQKHVARLMFTHDPKSYRHWYTSVVTLKLGKPPKPSGI